MYSLYCPSCNHTSEQPFVRVGAVARCESCGVVYRIGREHYAHHAAPRHELKASEADPLLPHGKPAGVDAAQQPSGLTGLSGLMEQERQAAARSAQPEPTPDPLPEATPGSGSGLRGMQPASPGPGSGLRRLSRWMRRDGAGSEPAHRRMQATLLALALGLVLAVAALLLMLYLVRDPSAAAADVGPHAGSVEPLTRGLVGGLSCFCL